MPHSKNKFRELFRFFERLSFLIFIEVSEPIWLQSGSFEFFSLFLHKNVLRKKQNSALQKLIFYENIAIYIL